MRITVRTLSLLLLCMAVYPFASTALSASPEKQSEFVYLSIVSTQTQTLEFIEKYNELVNQFSDLRIINSSDCSNLKQGLVLIASAVSDNKAEIDKALNMSKKNCT